MTILRKNLFAVGFAAIFSFGAASQSRAAVHSNAPKADARSTVAIVDAPGKHTEVAATSVAVRRIKNDVAYLRDFHCECDVDAKMRSTKL